MSFDGQHFLDGQLLLIDKPIGWSSFQVVNKIRYAIRHRYSIKKIKIGHAGTLDPLASGLLILCTGRYTKRISEWQGQSKTYVAEISLGATTPSYDLETEVDQYYPIEHITSEYICKIAKEFEGDLIQYPPMYSALKKEGKRLYEYARKGESVNIKARQVYIHHFDIININLPIVQCRISCSKGTYIRSIAYDMGKILDSGGHLSALRRTQIGDYKVDDALSPEQFIKKLEE